MKYLIAGSGGQLGSALVALLGDRVVWAGDQPELDIRDAAAVSRILHQIRPQVVVNAAAYVNVDQAETEVAEALAVNAAGPAHLARGARDVGALLVHVSTDFVFDGHSGRPYTEQDCPRPLNVYGTTKLAGEQLVAVSGADHLIVRSSAIYGRSGSQAKGGSFVDRILDRARSGQPLRVVSDQVVSPTYAPDLARSIEALIEKEARGLVHVTNYGSCTWHAFAVEILRCAGIDQPVAEIRARDLLSPARRPAHAILSKERFESFGLAPLRTWTEALREFLE